MPVSYGFLILALNSTYNIAAFPKSGWKFELKNKKKEKENKGHATGIVVCYITRNLNKDYFWS